LVSTSWADTAGWPAAAPFRGAEGGSLGAEGGGGRKRDRQRERERESSWQCGFSDWAIH
jgi:hypothetical protein